MMEAENKTCHEVQLFSNWLNTVRLMMFSPWNNHGANLAWSIAEAKLLNKGDCNPVPVTVCCVYINVSMELPQNQKHLYPEKLAAYLCWEPVNPDATRC